MAPFDGLRRHWHGLRARVHQLARSLPARRLAGWPPARRVAARWAALSPVRRRVLAAAVGLLLASVLLTSTVSAALLTGGLPFLRPPVPAGAPSAAGAPAGQLSSAPRGAAPTPTYGPPAQSTTAPPATVAPHATPPAHPTAGATPTAGAPSGAGAQPTAAPHATATPPTHPTAGATPTAGHGSGTGPGPQPTPTKPPTAGATPTPHGGPANTVAVPASTRGHVASANGPTTIVPHAVARPSSGSTADVLILGTSVTGGTSSVEAQEAAALGLSVEVDDATAWAAKTTADFSQYKAIVLGDPTCPSSPDPYLAPAEANPSVWGPAITGNVILIGTDPAYHAPSQPGAPALINAGIAYAAGRPGTTGLYFTLSCYYYAASAGTDVPVLDAISTPGTFTVQGQGGACPNTAHIVNASEALAGLSDAVLSGWSCSTHAGFDTWPADFSVLAINEDIASSYVAPDGSTGAPYIMARGTAATGAQGTERLGGGNASEQSSGSHCVCQPVDTYSGNFFHTFDLLAVPGRGLPLQLSLTYNAQAAAQSGPLGFGWTQAYGAALSVDGGTGNVTIAQENGSTVTFTPNGSGGYAAPSRVLANLVHNGDGTYSFTRVQDQTRLTFNASGQLVAEADRNGYATTFAYAGGVLTTVTDAAGRTLILAYDAGNRVILVTDPIGRSVAFTYDGSGNLATLTDVAGGVWHFTYDANHLMLTMTDPRGGVVTNVYDGSARVTAQTDAMSRATTFAYTAPDSNGNSSTTITDPNGNVTVDRYLNGMLVSQTKGSGSAQPATSTYSYDPVSLGLSSTIDPDGKISGQTWDANGNLLSSIDALDRITTYTYNAFNEVLTTTDPLGVTTTNTYDGRGNLLTTSRPLVGTSQVQTTRYAYGDGAHPGDVTAMADPNGRTWRYTYDAAGDRTSATDPLGDRTTSTYDGIGRLLTQVSPNGNVAGANPAAYTTHYAYDAFGDVTQVTDPLGHTTNTQYDADRDPTQATDADGHVTTNTYDLDGELTQVTRPDGSTLQYGYDKDGNQTAQIDGLGRTTAYAYDALDRLVSTTDPLARVTTYGYDRVGNRTALTDAAGQVTSYTFDAADQLSSIVYSDGLTPSVFYTYDADGQRLTMRDGTGQTSYTYDSLRRLTSETNGAAQTVGYAYDLDGHLTGITYPGGQTVTRSYDAAGRWRTVADWLGTTTRFRYDADGNLIETTLPNGVDATRTYDAADRLTTIADFKGTAGTPFLSFGYARDALGLLTTLQPLKPGAPTPTPNEAYTYTSLNQVSALNQTAYAYDHGDNLIQRGTATLTYDVADELTQLTQGATTTTYAYDARGDRTGATTGAATATYGYDQEGRLTAYSAGATTASYAYDGDGLRQSKTVDAVIESFTWDTVEGLPLLLQDGATQYVTGPGGLPLEQVSGSAALYYLADQLGSTRALTNATGAAVATYAYDAFGALTASTGSAVNPFRFAGQYTDAESGLVYLRARYYDPATAQFLTRDPLALLTRVAYGYANNDPLNITDAGGKFGLFDWLGQHAQQISSVAGAISDVASVISFGCDLVGLFTVNPVFVACGVVAGLVSTAADYVKLQADETADPGAVTEDLLSLGMDAGGVLIGPAATNAEKIATPLQHVILKAGEVVGAGRSLYDLYTEWRGTSGQHPSVSGAQSLGGGC